MPDPASHSLALVLTAFNATLGLRVGPDDDFFEIGGDSVASEQVLMRLEEVTGLTLPGWTLLDHPTARGVAGLLDRHAQAAG